jgi:uncharacterized damage-inducible protein DinB
MTTEPHDPPRSADEATTLHGFLDFYRSVMARKLEGLSEEQARSTPTASSLSVGGLVHHLAWVEVWWFRMVFAGEQVDDPFGDSDDPDADLTVPDAMTVEELVAFYAECCERSRAIAAAAPDLDAMCAHPEREVSLRWILVHMIEETARHAGHADIIRETIDGRTGD